MQVDPDIPDAPDPQDVAVQDSTARILGPAERIVAETISEPGVTRGFVLADSTEKSPKCTVNTLLSVLQNLGVNLFEFWFFLLPWRQEFVGGKQPDLGFRVFPRSLPDLQSFVVDPTGQVEPTVQAGDLSLSAVQTISV
jgi:hypothetical protein